MTKALQPFDREVPVKNLGLDKRVLVRGEIRQIIVQEYADILEECLEAGQPWPFPELVVFWHAGMAHTVADGWHRLLAARRVKWPTPIPCEILHGTIRDATLYACQANARHGIRRSNEDKRAAVLKMLKDREWRKWSSREIARRCNVSDKLVELIRQHEGGAADPDQRLKFSGAGRMYYYNRRTDRGRKRQRLVEEIRRDLPGEGFCPYCGKPLEEAQ